MPERHPSAARVVALVALLLGSVACEDSDLDEAPPPPPDSPASAPDGDQAAETPCVPGPVDPESLPRRGWVRVCPGEFVMGSPHEERDRETSETQHPVTITRPFLLGSTEVTQGLWAQVMGDHPSWFNADGGGCPLADCDAYPVEQVSWLDAVAFCNALSTAEGLEECYEITGEHATWTWGLQCKGYRLPTEAEWEYAARADTVTAWSCGRDAGCLEGVAWYADNALRRTQPVASKAPNALGLHDVHGNVQEWVWDWFVGEFGEDKERDPLGAPSGSIRGLRGGAWHSPVAELRSAHRGANDPSSRITTAGLRVARTAPAGE